ncbi:MAG: TonB-dependent receptor plug domain-containing protein [Caulobacteraceae bacterium]|nr:TonB-dependent receptor plug domain-containing protein [Caulobacteraceae bacterium]
MNRFALELMSGAALALLFAAPASMAQTTPGPSANGTKLEEVVVTARRSAENLQSVPVAVTVLQQRQLDTKGVFTPVDLTYSTPGLSVAASISDRNNLTYNIRGEGQEFGTLFPAVITYFNEVPITQFGSGQFFDIGNIQVLRGPQGVLFGRVTDGGNIMVTPQHPTNRFEGYIETKLGDYGLHDFTGAINFPLIDRKLLLRAAFDVNRRDGFTKNLATGQDLDNVAYESFRVGLTVRPTDAIENYTVVSYQRTHDNGTSVVLSGINPVALANSGGGLFPLAPGVYGVDAVGNVVPFRAGLTPLTTASYIAAQQQRLAVQSGLGPRQVDYTSANFDKRRNLFAVNTTSVDLTPDIQLKNILGYVNVRDDQASNYGGGNGAAFLTCHSTCGDGSTLPYNSQRQYSWELRIAGKSLGKQLSWSVGTYWDYQAPAEQFQNDDITLGILHRVSVQYAVTKSAAGYAFAEYAPSVLPGLKVNGGVRYTHDSVISYNQTYLALIPAPSLVPTLTTVAESFGFPPATAAAVAAATTAPIPYGQCVNYAPGSLFTTPTGSDCERFASYFHALTYSGGLSYQLPSGQMVYGKVSRGYRPGGVNAEAPLGADPKYAPEYDFSVEIGLKGDWRIGGVSVRTNLAAYHDDYTNIQKNVVLVGPGGVASSTIRNFTAATIQGVEFEGAVIPVAGLTIGTTFAYTDAHYKSVPTAGQPGDPCNPTLLQNIGFCSSNLFAYTPRFQTSLSADWVLPLDPSIGEVSVGGRFYYQSKQAFNSTSALNPNAVEKGYGLLDLNALWRNPMGAPVDLSFFITNVTNKLYRIGSNDLSQNSSLGTRAEIYGPPRMFGFGLKYRFGASAGS